MSARTDPWRLVELASLLAALLGTAVLCLADYGWHLSRESLFLVAWSASPYVLLALAGRIARRLVVSPAVRPVTALLAVAVSLLSLAAYGDAALGKERGLRHRVRRCARQVADRRRSARSMDDRESANAWSPSCRVAIPRRVGETFQCTPTA